MPAPVRHILRICRAEFCRSAGSDILVEHVESRLGAKLGETTADASFALEAVYCLGNCGNSPAVLLEGFSWGYDRRQIWVDRGCQAEFSLADDRYPANPVSQVEPGSNLAVRTNEPIETHSRDGRVYYGRI